MDFNRNRSGSESRVTYARLRGSCHLLFAAGCCIIDELKKDQWTAGPCSGGEKSVKP